jgi:uncharacterized RDD family membrane protein YckC
MSQIPPPPPPNWQAQQYQPPPVPQQYGAPQYAMPQFGGFWIRFVASLIDSIVISIPIIVVIMVFAGGIFAGVGDMASQEDQTGAAIAFFFSLLFILPIYIIIHWLYEALMTSSESGATLGKRAVGLKVLKGDGTRLGFGRATGRHFAKVFISGALVPLYIGYIMAAFTDRKRSLHDMIADTVVIKI